MSECTFELVEQGDLLVLRIRGPIDARAIAPPALALYERRLLLIDGREVSEVSPFGRLVLRGWIRRWRALGDRMFWAHCSPALVAALGASDDALAEGDALISLFVPFRCPGCARSQRDLFALGALPVELPPQGLCEQCGLPLVFDGASDYFRVAQVHPSQPIEPEVARAIHRLEELLLAGRLSQLRGLAASRPPSLPAVPPRLTSPAGQ